GFHTPKVRYWRNLITFADEKPLPGTSAGGAGVQCHPEKDAPRKRAEFRKALLVSRLRLFTRIGWCEPGELRAGHAGLEAAGFCVLVSRRLGGIVLKCGLGARRKQLDWGSTGSITPD